MPKNWRNFIGLCLTLRAGFPVRLFLEVRRRRCRLGGGKPDRLLREIARFGHPEELGLFGLGRSCTPPSTLASPRTPRSSATSVLPSSPGEKVQSSPAIPHENWVIQLDCDNFGARVEKPKVQEGSVVREVCRFRFRPRLCLQGRDLLLFRVEVQKANSRKRS